jgi:nitrate reductase NapAB chaperone NapD
MKKLNPNGFNLYRNGNFLMVILQGENEEEAIKNIKGYAEVNNINIAELTYKQFKNHQSLGVEMKNIQP